jgi:hypothetical protein
VVALLVVELGSDLHSGVGVKLKMLDPVLRVFVVTESSVLTMALH